MRERESPGGWLAHGRLLPGLVVLREVDAEQFDDEQRPDLVLGGLAMTAMAQFEVAGRRCLAGLLRSGRSRLSLDRTVETPNAGA